METGQVFAYKNGVKNWSDRHKIHLVGHSLGVQTIRYFQYLLKIGFFDDEHKGEDRSSWIASLNCISGPFNGAPIVNNYGYNPVAKGFHLNSKTVKAFKLKVIAANLTSQGGTQNRINEEIISDDVSLRFDYLLGRSNGA